MLFLFNPLPNSRPNTHGPDYHTPTKVGMYRYLYILSNISTSSTPSPCYIHDYIVVRQKECVCEVGTVGVCKISDCQAEGPGVQSRPDGGLNFE